MRCKTCHYSLANLTPSPEGGHRCPECGRAFDPDDPESLDAESSPSPGTGFLIYCAIVFTVLAVLAFLALGGGDPPVIRAMNAFFAAMVATVMIVLLSFIPWVLLRDWHWRWTRRDQS